MTASHLTTLLHDYPSYILRLGGSGVLLGTFSELEVNLAGYAFPGWSTADTRSAAAEALLPTLRKMRRRRWTYCTEMNALSAHTRYLLLERGQITSPMAARQEGVYVLVDSTQDSLCFINDESHLLVRTFYPPEPDISDTTRRAAAEAVQMRNALSKKLTLAWDPVFGYLADDPARCGENIYTAYLVHLPGLCLAGHTESIIRAMDDMGIFLAPVFSTFKNAEGNLYLAHSPSAQLRHLNETMQHMNHVMHDLTRQELNARAKLLQTAQSSAKVKRELRASVHHLMQSEHLTYCNTLHCLSMLRLAMHYGWATTEHPQAYELLGRAYLDIAPVTLRKSSSVDEMLEVRKIRAAYMRELLNGSLKLTLSNILE